MSDDPARRGVSDDDVFMRRAIDLALDRMGETWPNPAVGCVIVKDGRLLAEAATAAGGRPTPRNRPCRLPAPRSRARPPM